MKHGKRFAVFCTAACLLAAGCSSMAVASETAQEEAAATETITSEAAAGESVTSETEAKQHAGERKGTGPSMDGKGRGNMRMQFGVGSEGDRKPVTETDPEILKVIEENSGKFQQFTFEDPETGISLEYSLYIPENYDASAKYPMIMYIPDASGASKTAKEIVEQYYGANVWVTDEEQAKHSSFVLVPAFSVVVVDDGYNVSEEIEAAKNLIGYLSENYAIDANRLYTTGQSMGCMTSLYLNSQYPELFAASLFVSGQWDISVLKPLENASFFYITAAGDEKASGGQQEVKEMFEADQIPVSFGTWSAQASEEDQNQKTQELLSEGAKANMIRFEQGTVFTNGESGMEHNASFVYGYKIPAVRDWLFEQSR